MKTRQCLTCGKTFSFPDYRNRNYCSNACKHKAKKKDTDRICKYCKRKFYRPPSEDAVYCSVECYYQDNDKEPAKLVTCQVCGKKFKHRTQNDTHPGKYCSQKCLSESQKIRETRECKQCGKVFEIQPCFRKQFCSFECSAKWYTGGKHPNWKDGTGSARGKNWRKQAKKARKRDKYTCQVCGVTQEEYGKTLEVHHIVRFGDFSDYKEANQLDNLLTVCRSCHMRLENNGNSFKAA